MRCDTCRRTDTRRCPVCQQDLCARCWGPVLIMCQPCDNTHDGDGMAWKRHGACHGMPNSIFYPGRGETADPAKAICAGCPVLDRCRTYAITAGERFGVWGGLSERERRRVRTPREPRKAVHGTRTKYATGCRCDRCRDAANLYKRQLRASGRSA